MQEICRVNRHCVAVSQELVSSMIEEMRSRVTTDAFEGEPRGFLRVKFDYSLIVWYEDGQFCMSLRGPGESPSN